MHTRIYNQTESNMKMWVQFLLIDQDNQNVQLIDHLINNIKNIHAWVPNTGNQLCYQQQMQYVNIGFILRSSAEFFWWLKSNNVWQVGCHSCLAFKGRWAYFLRYYYIGEIDWVNANQNRLGNVEASYWGCQKFCLAGLRNWGVRRTDWSSKSHPKEQPRRGRGRRMQWWWESELHALANEEMERVDHQGDETIVNSSCHVAS